MNKLILPTQFWFDIVLNLYHLVDGNCKINFTKDENAVLDSMLRGPFTPRDCHYYAGRPPQELNELNGDEAKRFAHAIKQLVMRTTRNLTDGQYDTKMAESGGVCMAAKMIDWALDTYEIPAGSRGKVIIHCEAQKEKNCYVVRTAATSPGYTHRDKKKKIA